MTPSTKEYGIGSLARDDFVSDLRQDAARVLRVFPGLIPPVALLSLQASDTWRKVLSQQDLWGGANLTLITDAEYTVPIDLTIKTLDPSDKSYVRRNIQKRDPCRPSAPVTPLTSLLPLMFNSEPRSLISEGAADTNHRAPVRAPPLGRVQHDDGTNDGRISVVAN